MIANFLLFASRRRETFSGWFAFPFLIMNEVKQVVKSHFYFRLCEFSLHIPEPGLDPREMARRGGPRQGVRPRGGGDGEEAPSREAAGQPFPPQVLFLPTSLGKAEQTFVIVCDNCQIKELVATGGRGALPGRGSGPWLWGGERWCIWNAAASGHWAPVWGHLLWPDLRDQCQCGPQACPKGPSSATEMETWRTVFHRVTLKLT